MSKIEPLAVMIVAGVIGLAIVSVVVSSGNTTGLLAAVGSTLSGLVSKAVAA